MLSKTLLNEKYKVFLPLEEHHQQFLKDLQQLKDMMNLEQINKTNAPLLIYTNQQLKPLYYLMCVNYSLRANRILDYLSIRAQTFIRQHFADSERDQELYDKIYYTDVLFVVLSQADYTSEYLETLLQDLVTFRASMNTHTILIYEVLDKTDRSYMGYTKKLRNYFEAQRNPVIDLISGITTQHNATTHTKIQGQGTTQAQKQRKQPRRII